MPKLTLKAARVNVNLTQKEAATALNISNKTLCSWENGETKPNLKYVDAICKLYNVEYSDLIFLP